LPNAVFKVFGMAADRVGVLIGLPPDLGSSLSNLLDRVSIGNSAC
jgi:hypothetical protein